MISAYKSNKKIAFGYFFGHVASPLATAMKINFFIA